MISSVGKITAINKRTARKLYNKFIVPFHWCRRVFAHLLSSPKTRPAYQISNLTLLLESVEDELKAQREYVQVAETTEAGLLRLRTHVEEVEGGSHEAYQKRRELVKLLVAGIMAGKHDDGSPDVRITYRFGPPEPYPEEDLFASGVENGPAQLALKHSSNRAGEISRMPPI